MSNSSKMYQNHTSFFIQVASLKLECIVSVEKKRNYINTVVTCI